MRILLTTLTAMLCVVLCAPSLALQRDPGIDSGYLEHVPSGDLVTQQGGCTSLSQAVEQVRRQYNGRIVSAETQVSGGRETHVIKVLTGDGTVKTVRIPGCRV
jgi:hypothetical protein